MLLRTSEAAELLAISERQLYTLTRSGSLPCVRIGRLVRYSPDALRDWIATSESQKDMAHASDATKRSVKPVSKSTRRSARRKTSTTRRSPRQPAKKVTPAEKTKEKPAASKSPATSVAAPHDQRDSENRAEGRTRSILAYFAERLGVDEDALPRMTNGEIMRIAQVDTPILHGWAYRNRDIPDEAMNKLHEYFIAYLGREK